MLRFKLSSQGSLGTLMYPGVKFPIPCLNFVDGTFQLDSHGIKAVGQLPNFITPAAANRGGSLP